MDVRVEGMQPLILGEIGDVFRHHLVGVVVEEDVYGAHLLDRFVDDGLAVCFVFEIGGVGVAFAAVFLYESFGFLGVLFFFREVGDVAVCSFHGE